MSEFANEKNNNDNVEIKKNMDKLKTKLRLEDQYNYIKPQIKNIIHKGNIKEWHPKILSQPLSFVLVPNNVVDLMIDKRNKFNLYNGEFPNQSKIMQYGFTNRVSSNINHTKLDIKSSPFDPKNVEYKKNFNNYVANRIANHENKPIVSLHNNFISVYNHAFSFMYVKDIELTNFVGVLWTSYSLDNNVNIEYNKAVKKQICILNETNKNNLLKLINEIKIRISFNDYVNNAIKNHEKKPLFRVCGNSFVVDDKSYAFGKFDKKQAGNQVLKKLWESFVKKNNIKVDNKNNFKLSLFSTDCILSDENKRELYKLFDDAEKKVLDEQEKNLEEKIKKERQDIIRQKCSEYADTLINDIYKFENNYIECGERGNKCHNKNLLSGEYTHSRTLCVTKILIQEKLINSFSNSVDKAAITDEELKQIVDEVIKSKENEIKEKITSDIENRKQALKDFNDFVSEMIDKHNNKGPVLYEYKDKDKDGTQKFYLCLDGKFYDTVNDLKTTLIKNLADKYCCIR